MLGLLKCSRRELLVPWPWAACSTAGLIAAHSSAMMSLDHDANSFPPMDGGNLWCIHKILKNTCADPLKKKSFTIYLSRAKLNEAEVSVQHLEAS